MSQYKGWNLEYNTIMDLWQVGKQGDTSNRFRNKNAAYLWVDLANWDFNFDKPTSTEVEVLLKSPNKYIFGTKNWVAYINPHLGFESFILTFKDKSRNYCYNFSITPSDIREISFSDEELPESVENEISFLSSKGCGSRAKLITCLTSAIRYAEMLMGSPNKIFEQVYRLSQMKRYNF